jgi:DNA-binding NtrC family response regulator
MRPGDGAASNRHFPREPERALLHAMDHAGRDTLPSLEDVRRQYVLETFAAFHHKQGETARALGIDRKTLSRWLVRWNQS